MSGYVPVPHDALEAVPCNEWHAVVDLFKRAHALRWRPFEVTERSLSTRWAVSGRRVWGILDALAALGVLVVERGDGRKPSRVTVTCPTKEQQSRQQSRQQNQPYETPDVDECEAQGEAQDGELLTRPETEPETDGEPASSPALQLLPDLPAEEPPTVLDPTPKWARGHKGVPAIAVLAAVVRAIEAIRQPLVLVDPMRCGTDADAILGLWRKLGRPPIEDFGLEVADVAQWARAAPDAANDIRGIREDGSTWGKDRSRSVATLCVQKTWGDRLEATRRWHELGCPTTSGPLPARPFDPPRLAPGFDAPVDASDIAWLKSQGLSLPEEYR